VVLNGIIYNKRGRERKRRELKLKKILVTFQEWPLGILSAKISGVDKRGLKHPLAGSHTHDMQIV
jgi:hypothetical protein